MKSTATETEMRVSKVAGHLVNGWSRARICEYARESENWQVSDSQVDRYIAKARNRIRKSFEDEWDTNRAIANARFENIYCAAFEKGDLRTALRAVKEQVDLQKPESSKVVYAHDEDFMLCLYAYAEALRRIVPEQMLGRIVEEVQQLAPVAESFEQTTGFDYDKTLQGAVKDYNTLGRTRTREELIEDGFFDGLVLPS